MDEKLLKVLNLAFDKSANENEAVVAFKAAKRLMGDKPISSFFGNERIVYRDRGNRDSSQSWQLKFPKRFHLSLMKHIMNDVSKLDLQMNVTNFDSNDNGTYFFDFEIKGSHSSVKTFSDYLDHYYDQMKDRVDTKPKQTYTKPKKSEPPPAPKPEDRPKTTETKSGWKGFFKGMFS